MIKAAEEAGIYIDGEYKHNIGKAVKIYLAKTDSHIRHELYYAEKYQGDFHGFEDMLKREEDKYLFGD